jgi:hypothetical protein
MSPPIYKLKFSHFGYFFTFVVFCIRLLRKLWVLVNCKKIYEYLCGFTIIECIFLWGEIILSRNLYFCPFLSVWYRKMTYHSPLVLSPIPSTELGVGK